MQKIRTALIAGTAAIAVAGLAGAAAAQGPATHTLRVALPGGGVEWVHYTGDVAPQITFSPAPWTFPAMFGRRSPFAMLDRISAEMNRQAAAMLQQAQALTRNLPQQLSAAAFQNLPPGAHGYYFAATMNGNGVCSESMTITSQGNGDAPKIVRHVSGTCAPEGGPAGAAGLPTAPTPVQPPHLMQANAQGAGPYVNLVHPVAWER